MSTHPTRSGGFRLAAGLLLAGLVTGAAHADVTLAFKLSPGARTVRTEEIIQQTLTLAGNDVVTASKSVSTVRAEVSPTAADGSHRLKQTYTGLQSSLDLPGGLKLAFDSEKPDETKVENPALQPLVDAYKALKGTTYTLVVDKGMKVKAVEGTEGIPATLVATAGLSKESLKRSAEERWGLFPDKMLKKGDRWNRAENKDLGNGQNLAYDVFYEYAGSVEKDGRTLDKISVFINTAKLEIDPKAELPAKVKQSDLKVEASSGEILFDREAGVIVQRTSRTRIVGPLTLDVMGMELAGKLDLTLEQNTTEAKP